MDWAQKVIEEMAGLDDDATNLFRQCFSGGSSAEAWVRYASAATKEVWRDGYMEITFPDGSRYRDTSVGIDSFYPPGFGRDDRDIADDDPWE